MVRTPGLPSKVGGSGRGSDSSLLSAAGFTLGIAVGIVKAVLWLMSEQTMCQRGELIVVSGRRLFIAELKLG